MTTKASLICVFISALALAGCGNNDQQPPVDGQSNGASSTAPAAPAAPAAPEVTTAVAEDKIQVLGSDVLAAAQWTNAACSLDTVDGNYSKNQVKLISGKPHVFRGWLLNATKHPAGQFSLVLKGLRTFAVPASTGVTRADVGAFFKNPALSDAGFNFSSTLTSIPVGEYHVTFIIQEPGHVYFCDADKTLTVE